jgi:chitinase
LASVPPLTVDFEYFAQAVDQAGNVSLALDHGVPFQHYQTIEARLETATTSISETSGSVIAEVTLSTPPVLTATIGYTTLDGTAQAGADYVAAQGTLIFAPGITRTTISVALLNDNVYENAEEFSLKLSVPINVSLGSANQVMVTLLSDDPLPAVAFPIGTHTVLESSGSALITVTLNRPSVLTTTVAYATADGAAVAGSDYLPASGTLTFVPNTLSAAFSLQVIDDAQHETTETLTIDLSNPVNATLGAPQMLSVSIVDDDPAERKVYLPVIRR